MKRTTIGLVSALLLAGCLSHAMDPATTWRDPAATSSHFHRVIAVFVTKDSALRRAAEDRFAASIAGALPSYRVIPDSEITDPAKVRERIRQQNVDGAIIVRMVTVDQQVSNMPANIPYASPYDLWGSWTPSWAVAYDPQYFPAAKTLSVEGGLYSVEGNRLIWAGHSPTVAPGSVSGVIDRIVNGMVAVMKKENLL